MRVIDIDLQGYLAISTRIQRNGVQRRSLWYWSKPAMGCYTSQTWSCIELLSITINLLGVSMATRYISKPPFPGVLPLGITTMYGETMPFNCPSLVFKQVPPRSHESGLRLQIPVWHKQCKVHHQATLTYLSDAHVIRAQYLCAHLCSFVELRSTAPIDSPARDRTLQAGPGRPSWTKHHPLRHYQAGVTLVQVAVESRENVTKSFVWKATCHLIFSHKSI